MILASSLLLAACGGEGAEAPQWQVASDEREVPRSSAEEESTGEEREPWTGSWRAELVDDQGEELSEGFEGARALELILAPGALEQRIDGVTTYRGLCERSLESETRVVLDCVGAEERASLWPLELRDDGAMIHRAQPEILYRQVAQ